MAPILGSPSRSGEWFHLNPLDDPMQPWDERVLVELCALLPPELADTVWDFWGHAEAGLAFETAVDQLSEDHVPIDATLRQRVAEAARYSDRVLDGLRFCPDAERPRWHVVENTLAGLEIEERLPGKDDVAWLACDRCPEVLVPFDSYAASMGTAPLRYGVLAADGAVAVFTAAISALDHLERCWS
jgi:hypothetical protein